MQSSLATDQLSSLLERVASIDKQIGDVESQLGDLKRQRDSLEALAVEEFRTQRLDGVRVAGRSWRVEEALRLSVPKDRRDAVLEAARAVGIEDAITTVATPTLKAWLVERAREAGREAGSPFTTGTPFAGIVGEFVETKLRHVTVG